MPVEAKIAASFLVAEGVKILEPGGSPRLDAEVLLAFVLGLERSAVITNPDMEVDDKLAEKYRSLIERRGTGEPVAYITGRKEFYKESFTVNRSVLIPRPETEGIVEETLNRFRDRTDLSVLDIGTGSGCIALSIALERPDWRVTGVDLSADALSVAVENRRNLGADNVEFLQSDLFASVDASTDASVDASTDASVSASKGGRYDIVVSNPPYIDREQVLGLPDDVRRFEPHLALLADNEGLFVIERLLRDAVNYLNRGGTLFCEIGFDQKEKVRDILDTVPGKPWSGIEFINDLAGHPRIFVAGLKG
jgi:release factor glutamine methyltransferase